MPLRPGDWSVPEPVYPTAPTLANWPCPPGWEPRPTFVDERGEPDLLDGIPHHLHCRPPIPTRDCAPGTMPLAGWSDCRPQGPTCPTDGERWPSEAELRRRAPGYGGAIVYAASGAVGVADGSRGAPYGAVAEAVSAASPGDIVAIALGETSEVLMLTHAIAVVGACVRGTRLVAPSRAESVATVRIRDAGGALLRDLTILGERPGVSTEGTESPSRLEAIRIEGALGIGVSAGLGGSISVAELYVKDTVPGETGFGLGLRHASGDEAVVERSTFENSVDVGLGVAGAGTRLVGRDVIIQGTRNLRDERGGALAVAIEGVADLRSSILEDNAGWGIQVDSPGTREGAAPPEVTLTDVVVRGSSPGTALGIRIADGAAGAMNRVFVSVPGSEQVLVTRGGDLVMVDSLLQGQPASLDAPPASGLSVSASKASVERSVVSGAVTRGLVVSGTSTFAATDLVVAGTQLGWGGEVRSPLSLTRAAFARNRGHGLGVFGPVEASLTDVWLGETKPVGMGEPGAQVLTGGGLLVGGGAQLTARRVMTWRTFMLGTMVFGERTVADIEDLWAIDVVSYGFGACMEAMGFIVVDGARARVDRLAVTRVRGVGVQALLGGELDAVRLSVAGIESVPCGASAVARAIGGFGVSSDLSGHLEVSDFLVKDTARAGLQAAADSHLCLRAGTVVAERVCVNDQHRPGTVVECSRDLTLDCPQHDDDEDVPPPSIGDVGGLEPAP